jgi:hypothetical protein
MKCADSGGRPTRNSTGNWQWPYCLTKVGVMEDRVYAETLWPYDAIRWAMWKEAGNRQWPYCLTRWA